MLHHHLHPQHLRGFAKLFNSGKFSYENILKSWHCTFLSNDITLNTLKLFILPELGLQPFRECKSQKIPQSFRRAWICKIVRQKCCICNLFKFWDKTLFFSWSGPDGYPLPDQTRTFFPTRTRPRKFFRISGFKVAAIYAIISPVHLLFRNIQVIIWHKYKESTSKNAKYVNSLFVCWGVIFQNSKV